MVYNSPVLQETPRSGPLGNGPDSGAISFDRSAKPIATGPWTDSDASAARVSVVSKLLSDPSGPLVEDMGEDPRILVAHSASPECELIVEELKDHRVLLARDGEEVLSLARVTPLDAIILDEDLPPAGGIELCRRLKREISLASVPIAITTERSNEDSMADALAAGAHEFLFKPFSPTELQIRIRNLVQTHLYLAELERKNRVLNEALENLCESEAMLVQAEKLSVLGEMSAGIVHEINNPLNYSKTATFILGELVNDLDGEQQEEFRDVIRDITEGIERVTHIVKDLRAFATKGNSQTTELNLVTVVRTARRLLGNRLSNISYTEEVPEELRIQANENQLCQVVLNLIKNGLEATEMAGRRLDEAEIRVTARDTEFAVELTIRDNGCGISADDEKRIFEPFFTRKAKGKGMGLGLSICRRILDDHGGSIRIQSETGRFTEFTLVFPHEAERPMRPVPGWPDEHSGEPQSYLS